MALTRCFFCLEGDKIVLNTLLTPHMAKSVESMNNMVIDMEPCQKCADYMKQGVIFITIDDSKSEPGWSKPDGRTNWIPNPYRTGGFSVVRDEAVRKFINDPGMADWAIKHRWMFIEHEAAERLGLLKPTDPTP